MALDLCLLTLVAFACHSALAADRPSTARLTEFYMLLSVGGLLGGTLNGLVAPLVFNRLVEYPLVVMLALGLVALPRVKRSLRESLYAVFGLGCALAAATVLRTSDWRPTTTALVAVLLVAVLAGVAVRSQAGVTLGATVLLVVPLLPHEALLQTRTFYGVYRVLEKPGEHTLLHGAIVHGAESTTRDGFRTPLTYYTRGGPIGQLFDAYADDPRTERVAVVGLGAGSMAAYSRAGDDYTFFELDPTVARIAENPRYFTFLDHAAGSVRLVIGDGRLRLADEPDGDYGVVVLDAFSSDAIPVHLLTEEAIDLYLQKLEPQGLVVFHISNRYLDLAPVLSSAAREIGLVGAIARDLGPSTTNGWSASTWVALARDPAAIDALLQRDLWQPLAPSSGPAWTDDYSNVLSALR
jgi:hypothetical protein